MIFIDRLKEELQHANSGVYVMTFDKHTISLKFFAVQLVNVDNNDSVVSLEDISEFATLQRRVTQAEKLEAVGRLAAGIAHEINTPIQYVMSNVDFLAEAMEEMKIIMDEIGTLGSESDSTTISNILSDIQKKFEDIEWDFLNEEIPEALQQTKEGLRRIESIVSAMKQFSHPAGDTAELCNINEAISATTMVARNEWKYIADMDLALDPELPAIRWSGLKLRT